MRPTHGLEESLVRAASQAVETTVAKVVVIEELEHLAVEKPKRQPK
jgi:hypothetical protein